MTFDVLKPFLDYGIVGVLCAVLLWVLYTDRKDMAKRFNELLKNHTDREKILGVQLEKATQVIGRAATALEETAISNARLADAVERLAPPKKTVARLRVAK
jgi:hypothetical protein